MCYCFELGDGKLFSASLGLVSGSNDISIMISPSEP